MNGMLTWSQLSAPFFYGLVIFSRRYLKYVIVFTASAVVSTFNVDVLHATLRAWWDTQLIVCTADGLLRKTRIPSRVLVFSIFSLTKTSDIASSMDGLWDEGRSVHAAEKLVIVFMILLMLQNDAGVDLRILSSHGGHGTWLSGLLTVLYITIYRQRIGMKLTRLGGWTVSFLL